MGLKGAASSLMQAYKCWSLWSLLPAVCWSGLEEQLLQRPEDEALGATGRILQEKTRGSLWLNCGGWGHDRALKINISQRRWVLNVSEVISERHCTSDTYKSPLWGFFISKKKKIEVETQLLQSFTIDYLICMWVRPSTMLEIDLCCSCRKAGHWCPKLENYLCFLWPKLLSQAHVKPLRLS